MEGGSFARIPALRVLRRLTVCGAGFASGCYGNRSMLRVFNPPPGGGDFFGFCMLNVS